VTTREEVLSHTFPDADSVEQRVFYNLIQGGDTTNELTASRCASLLSALIEQLRENEVIDADQLNEMLYRFGQDAKLRADSSPSGAIDQ
jgi:hypothetical protein